VIYSRFRTRREKEKEKEERPQGEGKVTIEKAIFVLNISMLRSKGYQFWR
jgi:hypothetical protein